MVNTSWGWEAELLVRVGKSHNPPPTSGAFLPSVRLFLSCSLYNKAVIGLKGLPWWLSGNKATCSCKRIRFDPEVRKVPRRRMSTHCSILAWEISWTEVAGGLQPKGSQSQTRLSSGTESTFSSFVSRSHKLLNPMKGSGNPQSYSQSVRRWRLIPVTGI